MTTQSKPSFLLLFLLISFGSITAVAFTPALPQISQFFHATANQAGMTVTWFLVGYAVGQLLYGPLSNRFGRKKALYIGITVEILASLLCILAGPLHSFGLLVFARLLMALGASVGLKMSFTLVNDSYTAEESRQLISHLMVAFAVTPAIGIAIGGFLAAHFAWTSTFYFMAVYGLLLLALSIRMTETAKFLDPEALKGSKIIKKYASTLKSAQLPLAAILMGCGTSFVYVFAALAPFIGMEWMGLSPSQYGLWNLLPSVGILIGSQLSARFSQHLQPIKAIFIGISFMFVGVIMMLAAFLNNCAEAIWLFLPLLIMYIGLSFVFSNASAIATSQVEDKSNASAMMSFINMGVATLSVLSLGFVHTHPHWLLPAFFTGLIGVAIVTAMVLKKIIASNNQ